MALSEDSSFDDRLSHWIASQGFWFQLRHGSGRTGAAKLLARLFQVLLRLGVVVLLGVGAMFLYLLKRTDMKSFREGMSDTVAAALGAESAEVRGFQRERGKVYIHRLGAEGGPESFFYSFDARGVRYEMGLLDGLVGEWKAGPVTVTAARIEVKAGAEDEAEAETLENAFFGEHGWFDFPLVEVLNTSVMWGYSERTRGSIHGSHLIAQQVGDDWLLQFRGGRLSQNWLRRLEIDEVVVRVSKGEVKIEKAEFRKDGGWVELTGVIKGGVAPQIDAKMEFDSLPMATMLTKQQREFVDGTLSGEATISGSTNTQEGVGFDCEVLLADGDQLHLRDRVPLLQALTVVDVYNSYRRVDFNTGGFRMTTGAGRMTIDSLDLKAPDLVDPAASDLMHLSGGLVVRPPTDEEVAKALADGPSERESSFFDDITDEADSEEEEGEESAFTLRKAAEASRSEDDDASGAAPSVGMSNSMLLPMTLEQQARDRYARMLRFDGGFLMEIPGNAFERARVLRESYPVDPSSGRISLEVPMSGSLFDLTFDQAQEVYSKGRRDN